jgi:hypothetical protein
VAALEGHAQDGRVLEIGFSGVVVWIVFSRRWFVFDGLRHHFLPIGG